MKKIALIVVIVACVASLALVWKVGGIKKQQKTKIAQLTDTQKDTDNKLDKTKTELIATKKERDQVQGKLADIEAKFSVASTALEEKTKAETDLQAKVTDLDKEASGAKASLAEAEGTLKKVKGALTSAGIDVSSMDEFLQKVTAQGDENKMLGVQLAKLRNENIGLQKLAATPEGLKARVAVVEGKWGFVVLDIGYNKKVHQDAQFLVYRDRQLIAKVQVTSVGLNTCVAQILSGYKLGMPRVGDWATR